MVLPHSFEAPTYGENLQKTPNIPWYNLTPLTIINILGGEYKHMQNKYVVPIVAVVVLVAAVVGVMKFGGMQTPAPSTETTMMEVTTQPEEAMTQETTLAMEQEATTETSESMEEGQMFTVEGGNFTFAPNEIRVKKGETVKILFKNVEGFHDFVIDEFDVKTAQLQADMEEMVEFTPMEAGEYEFYCSVGKHREMGMVGTLIVE